MINKRFIRKTASILDWRKFAEINEIHMNSDFKKNRFEEIIL